MSTTKRTLIWSLASITLAAGSARAQQRALQLDNSALTPATSGYVRIADDPGLTPQQFTLEAWIKPTGQGYGGSGLGTTILAKPQEGTLGTFPMSWMFCWVPSNPTQLFFGVRNQQGSGTYAYSIGGVPVSTSAHVAITFDGQSIRFFINGALDSTHVAVGTGVFYDDSDVLIGACNFGAGYLRRFEGQLDEVRIWDHARVEADIAADSSCRLSGAEPGLLAYYTFNGGNALDQTGHGHDGTVEGTLASFVVEPVSIEPCCPNQFAYCTAGTTTNGCVASISGSGTPSASAASGFTISVSNMEGQKSGLIFYGINGPLAVPWGTSTSVLCVKSPTQRLAADNSGGTTGQCDGTLSNDWLIYIAAHPLALGAPCAFGETVNAQGWFRDPGSSKTTSLSNALQFTVCP